MRRRCAYAKNECTVAREPVWARRSIVSFECPRSIVTGESEALLQLFEAVLIGGLPSNWPDMDARTIDAVLLLHSEFRKEGMAWKTRA